MKKFISIVAAMAMSAVMAVSAFAASNDVANLKALASEAGAAAGVDVSAFNAFIDDYAEEHADKITADVVNELAAIKANVVNTAAANRTEAFIAEQGGKAVKALSKAGITVTPNYSINGNVIGGSVTLSAPDAKSATISANIVGQVNGSASTAGSTAAGATTGVIKNTGVNATSAIVLAVAVAGVLGGAVVGARKMNLLAQ